ncbi:RNA polymerase sigma-70 factor (ECF subfamily) [Rhodopirellula rubra]|uniref:RNA polymerase sigma-70 factor (ECF subfamily) n=1 Tax=Aporhodopirellula rubra TaxID=980271 RepID=A0A7W5DWT1_9BACT|nr:sigma-70 family RNA polymerase sigma factor [Aporhodopirellula rubra]MBB3205961.1 RNA polymerase sigma-70 factor (ECF subfamily) [Aporhodopirellula rubra]
MTNSEPNNDRLPMRDLSPSQEFAAEIAAIQPRLYGFILKRLADREQTLELLQRTNLVLCEKSADFQHGSSFIAWAFTIARFQVMAWRKNEGRSRVVFTDQVCELIDRSAVDEIASVDERIPQLQQCLDRLREHDRGLIQRRYRDGDSLGLIAESLSKSVDALGMQLSRIRRQLAECVSKGIMQEPEYDI